jgi:tRNA A-37 threonylcarbamoyl transferase component Bud32
LVSQVESADRKPRADARTPQDTSFYDGATSWSGLPLPKEPIDPLVGTTLHETYVVSHILGEGGMGRIYEARHTRLPNKRFAIKVLHADLAMNSDLQLRFQREAETAASIEHPSVVGMYDIGRTPQGWQYMVCEHLTGFDLHTHIERTGPLEMATVAHIGKRLCEAVEAAHERGVIHRDLKPHNVFLVGDFALGVPERPNLKVLDFGLSRFVDGDSQLTKAGMIMGTPGYMSPEQAHSAQTDHRTDVYGVGAILYAAATGRPPFDEETPQMTVLAVMSREPERPRLLVPGVTEGLEVVIQRAMAKDPQQRYASMRDMYGALAALDGGLVPSVMPPKMHSEPANADEEGRSARLRLALWGLSGFSLLVMATIAAFAGLLALRGTTLDPTTTELVLLAALGAMSTFPAAIAIRRLRHHVWVNSAKVIDWLHRLRGPIIGALCAYGLAAFLTRFADELLARAGSAQLFGHPPGVAYRGYSIVLPMIGILTALAVASHRRWWRPRRLLRRWIFGPVLSVSTALACSGLIYLALQHRRAAPPTLAPASALLADPAPVVARPRAVQLEAIERPATELPATELPATELSATELPPPDDPTPPNASPSDPSPLPSEALQQHAPNAARVSAVAGGTDGLRGLSERYPRDPAVLKALMLAFASKSNTLVEALEAARRLLLLTPESQRDADLQYIVLRAADQRGKASELAFALMSQHMGRAGADLLYDLMLRRPELDTRARIGLDSLRHGSQFSPALAIAYDLRVAPSCASRLGLLSRAEDVGDERSANVLTALSRRPVGCKKTNHRTCKARCAEESRAFIDTARKIYTRLVAKKRR